MAPQQGGALRCVTTASASDATCEPICEASAGCQLASRFCLEEVSLPWATGIEAGAPVTLILYPQERHGEEDLVSLHAEIGMTGTLVASAANTNLPICFGRPAMASTPHQVKLCARIVTWEDSPPSYPNPPPQPPPPPPRMLMPPPAVPYIKEISGRLSSPRMCLWSEMRVGRDRKMPTTDNGVLTNVADLAACLYHCCLNRSCKGVQFWDQGSRAHECRLSAIPPIDHHLLPVCVADIPTPCE